MKSLLPLAVAIATASFVPTSFAAPSDSALENANGNAKFLRCGTEHPSAADAAKQEKRFRELFRQTQNGKKPDRPGGGNGGGGDGGGGGGEDPPTAVPGALLSTPTSISSATTTVTTVLVPRVRYSIKCRC